LELREACATMRDMAEIDSILQDGAGPVGEEAATVCGMTAPTAADLRAAALQAPADAWAAVRAFAVDPQASPSEAPPSEASPSEASPSEASKVAASAFAADHTKAHTQ
jgi:hypothetical protein